MDGENQKTKQIEQSMNYRSMMTLFIDVLHIITDVYSLRLELIHTHTRRPPQNSIPNPYKHTDFPTSA